MGNCLANSGDGKKTQKKTTSTYKQRNNTSSAGIWMINHIVCFLIVRSFNWFIWNWLWCRLWEKCWRQNRGSGEGKWREPENYSSWWWKNCEAESKNVHIGWVEKCDKKLQTRHNTWWGWFWSCFQRMDWQKHFQTIQSWCWNSCCCQKV